MAGSQVLTEIIAHKRRELVQAKRARSLDTVKAMAETLGTNKRDIVAAFKNTRNLPVVIAECKKSSPSRGVIKEDYDPITIALGYERAGAGAISVLTDTQFFSGSLDDLAQVSDAVRLPVLRKDFIIDEYQIYESRCHGAASFLLIAGVLDTAQLQYYCEIGRDFGMEPLVEVHSEQELEMALATDAKIIGINNRDLRTLKVDLNHSFALAELVRQENPKRILVCESGLRSHQDLLAARNAGFDACLIGEHLMAQVDSETALRELLAHEKIV